MYCYIMYFTKTCVTLCKHWVIFCHFFNDPIYIRLFCTKAPRLLPDFNLQLKLIFMTINTLNIQFVSISFNRPSPNINLTTVQHEQLTWRNFEGIMVITQPETTKKTETHVFNCKKWHP